MHTTRPQYKTHKKRNPVNYGKKVTSPDIHIITLPQMYVVSRVLRLVDTPLERRCVLRICICLRWRYAREWGAYQCNVSVDIGINRQIGDHDSANVRDCHPPPLNSKWIGRIVLMNEHQTLCVIKIYDNFREGDKRYSRLHRLRQADTHSKMPSRPAHFKVPAYICWCNHPRG